MNGFSPKIIGFKPSKKKTEPVPVFRSTRGKQFTARRIQQIVTELTATAEIISIEVTPHMLRHTRATFLAEDGMSEDSLQSMLGHENGETTEIYTKTAAIDVGREFQRATQTIIE